MYLLVLSRSYPGEGVHGTLHRVAGEALNAVEGVSHELGPLGEAVEDVGLLLRKRLERGLALAGRVHHDVHASLKTGKEGLHSKSRL
jgi:hypothetical protein